MALFNAASISLFDNDTNNAIELVLIDSKEGTSDTKKAFQEIIDRKIKIVIGPIFSASIEAIAEDAKANQIAVISLSNNQQLSGKIDDEGGIFLAGMLPEAQVDKVVSYAMQKGKFSFSIIAPNNQYGLTTTALLKKIVKNRDGKFITSEFYESNGKDLDKIVERLVNAFGLPAHLSKKPAKDLVINESDRSYAQVIMIPESGKILSRIVDLIKQKNKDERDFQIVGTSQWDDASTLNDYNLSGAYFAAPVSDKFHNFERVYFQNYSKFPPRISSIVYDAVDAAIEIANRGKGKTPTAQDFINFTNPPKNGFEGIDGLFRFLPNGLVQRNLAILQINSGSFVVVDSPADMFLKY